MINVDGVVSGNYRTSFLGKDLNRLFIKDQEDIEIDSRLIPEINGVLALLKEWVKPPE